MYKLLLVHSHHSGSVVVTYHLHEFFMHFLPLGRYPDVGCILQSEKHSSLDLGLLDFGASYTVILTNVSTLVI